MEEFPCPHCELVFLDLDELYDHVFDDHKGEHMHEITRKDFTQIDSRWIAVVNGVTLMVEADESGNFKLKVMGTLGEIPPATRYPTEPEWEQAELLANEIYRVSTLAERRL